MNMEDGSPDVDCQVLSRQIRQVHLLRKLGMPVLEGLLDGVQRIACQVPESKVQLQDLGVEKGYLGHLKLYDWHCALDRTRPEEFPRHTLNNSVFWVIVGGGQLKA